MKSLLLVITLLVLPGSAMASGQAIHLPKVALGVFTPQPVVVATIDMRAQPTLMINSQHRTPCVITDADAKKLGTSLLDLARILSPKNQTESVTVTCQEGNDPYASATLVDLTFM